jgi:hypothetical protein
MTVTISRLYNDYEAASRIVQDLEVAGIPESDISIVASNADSWYSDGVARGKRAAVPSARVDRDADGVDDRAEGAGTGAGIGATIGGAAGLLAGLGLLAIPGVGPVVAAGWLASTALGALAGGAAGGAIGALTQAGISEEDAPIYAEGVRRGGSIVSVRVSDGERARVEAILDRSAVDIRARAADYRKSGWTEFDESAPPFTADEVRRERGLYAPGRARAL